MQGSDDEFEEFEEENWPLAKKEDSSLWNTDWDTDEIDPTFAEKLRRKLEESAAAAAASAPPAQNGQEE